MLCLIMKWLQAHALKIIVLVVGAVIWHYATFATIDRVDSKHTEVMKMLERIDVRLWRLIKADKD